MKTQPVSLTAILPGIGSESQIREAVGALLKHTPQLQEVRLVADQAKGLQQLVSELSQKRSDGEKSSISMMADMKAALQQLSTDFLAIFQYGPARVTENWFADILSYFSRFPRLGIAGTMPNPACQATLSQSSSADEPDGLNHHIAALRKRLCNCRKETFWIAEPCAVVSRCVVDAALSSSFDFCDASTLLDQLCIFAAANGWPAIIAGDVWVQPLLSYLSFESSKKSSEKWRQLSKEGLTDAKLRNLQAMENAEVLYQQGRFNEACETLMAALKIPLSDPRLSWRLTELLIEAKLWQTGLKVLANLTIVRNHLCTRLLSAYCQHGLGNLRAALKQVDEILHEIPICAPALNLKAVLAYQKGDDFSARIMFQKAIQADPGYGEPFANMAIIQWQRERKHEALDYFESAFRRTPLAPDNLKNLFSGCVILNEFPKLDLALHDLLCFYPNNQLLEIILVESLIKQKRFAEAMVQLEKMLDASSSDERLAMDAAALRRRIRRSDVLASSGQPEISLCMIVKDEQGNIGRCLRSVKGLVDEMVVVDTGSLDNTRSIAEAYGAKIFSYTWNGDFAAARNYGLENVSGKWVLVLDADEVISPSDHSKIRELIHKNSRQPIAYQIETRNYSMRANTLGWEANNGSYPCEEAGAGWYPSTKVRLFPSNISIRFRYPVHEIVEPDLRAHGYNIEKCEVPVHHYGKLDEAQNRVKAETYYLLGKRKLNQLGNNLAAIRELAVQAGNLNRQQEAIELWKNVLAIEPKMVEAYINIGTAYWYLGKYSEALEFADKAKELAPHRKEPHFNAALAHLFLGDAIKSCNLLMRLVNRIPNYLPARFMLAMSFACSGKLSKAESALAEIKKTYISSALDVAIYDLIDRLEKAQHLHFAKLIIELAVKQGCIKAKNIQRDKLSSYPSNPGEINHDLTLPNL